MMTIVTLIYPLLTCPLNKKCLTLTTQVLTGDRTQNQKSGTNYIKSIRPELPSL